MDAILAMGEEVNNNEVSDCSDGNESDDYVGKSLGCEEEDSNNEENGESENDNNKENGERENNDKKAKKISNRGGISLPSFEEQGKLRESGNIFRSNLIALEVQEMLQEVRVEGTKKSKERIEEWLFLLKEVLESLASAQVTEQSIHDCLKLSHHTSKEVVLEFQAPSNFDLVGSYLLKALSKPGRNIDICMEIPSSCFLPKDILNHRYFDKRALYVAHVAQELNGSELMRSVKFSYFRGDPRKPVILLEPAIKTKFEVRLFPSVGQDVLAHSKFSPARNNVRPKTKTTEAPEDLLPTPHYTSAVLEDMGFKRHLIMLHQVTTNYPAIVDVIILAKVWLAQRGLRASYDSLNGFTISMILVYLVQVHQISARMDAVHMFQLLLKFLASDALTNQVLALQLLEGDTDMVAGEEDIFKESFDCVLLDPGLGLNLLSRVSATAIAEVREEALISLNLLVQQQGTETGHSLFAKVFLTKVGFWHKYDAFVQVSVSAEPGVNTEDEKIATILEGEELMLCNFNIWEYIAKKTTKILKEGLGDRVQAIRPLCGLDAEDERSVSGACCHSWEMNTPAPKFPTPTMTFGLRLNPENYTRRVDRGPPAENTEAALEFRRFWGERAELRRFKDRAIVEAVVWTAPREGIVEEVAKFVLMRHDPLRCNSKESVLYIGSQLDRVVAESQLDTQSSSSKGKRKRGSISVNESIEGWSTRRALEAYETLGKRLRELDGLPLKVDSILTTSPALRYTRALPISPSPFASAPADITKAAQGLQVTTEIDVIDIFIKLETSSKWPSTSEAIRKTASAFLVRIAQCLFRQYKLHSSATEDFLDIFFKGYVFRMRIFPAQEIRLLKDTQDPHERVRLQTLELDCDLATVHHSMVHGFQSRFPIFASVVRLAQLWLNAHGFGGHFRVEAIELLVASVFTAPAPFQLPSSIFSGFLKFLHILGHHDFEAIPIVVDFLEDINSDDLRNIQNNFEQYREGSPGKCSLFLVASYAKETNWNSHWTTMTPECVVVQRIKAVALKCTDEMILWMRQPCQKKSSRLIKKLFQLSMEEAATFDVVISLKQSATYGKGSKRLMNEIAKDRENGCRLFRAKFYKNLSHSAILENVYLGFNHINSYIQTLQENFGHLALFFYNELATDAIYVVWRPQAMLPQAFTIMNSKYSSSIQADNAPFSIPNTPEILHDFRVYGKGLVEDIQVL